MHRRTPRLSRTRVDAALKAIGCYGFSRELVCRTIIELLTAYGKEGWSVIENNSYTILIETLRNNSNLVQAKNTHLKEDSSKREMVKNAEDSPKNIPTGQFSHASSKAHCLSEIDEDGIPQPQALNNLRSQMISPASTNQATTLTKNSTSTLNEHDNFITSSRATSHALPDIISPSSRNIKGTPEEMQLLPLKKRWRYNTTIEDTKIVTAKETLRDAIQLNITELIEQEKSPEFISSIGILLEAESTSVSTKSKLRKLLDDAQHLIEIYFSCKENSANIEAKISQYNKQTSKLAEKEAYIDVITKEVDTKRKSAKELDVEYEKLKIMMNKVQERQLKIQEDIKADQQKLSREQSDAYKMKNTLASSTGLLQVWRDSKVRADLQAQEVSSSWDVLRDATTSL